MISPLMLFLLYVYRHNEINAGSRQATSEGGMRHAGSALQPLVITVSGSKSLYPAILDSAAFRVSLF